MTVALALATLPQGTPPELIAAIEDEARDTFVRHGPSAFVAPREAAIAHEVGHTIVGTHEGLVIESVRIFSRSAPPFGKTWGGWCAEENGKEWTTGPDTSAESDLSRARIIIAGLAAEAMTGTDLPGSSIEERALSQLIAHNAAVKLAAPMLSDEARSAYAERLWNEQVWCRTLAILRENQDAFDRLAQLLHHRENVRGRQAARCARPGQEDCAVTTSEEGVALALDLLRIRHMPPTPDELEAVDRRGQHANSLGEWDAGNAPGAISPRQWLLGNQFCRSFISSIVAAGGTGKTALRLLQFISLATGRPLCGQRVFRRCRVLLISLEDDSDELQRRIEAVLLHYGIPRSELKGWLYCANPKLAKLAEIKNKTRTVGPLEQQIRDAISRCEPDIISLDPFVKTHALQENDSGDMDFVSDLLAQLAVEFDVAIDAPHHVHKGQLTPGDADSRRGSSGIRDAGRLVYPLTPMSEREAETFGIDPDERFTYVRLDPAKTNIAARAAKATWFRIIGVPLGNATIQYPNGDTIQVIEPWSPPDTWAGLDVDLLNRILSAIDAGMNDGTFFTAAPKATTRAAWQVVCKFAAEKSEGQAREVIGTWIKTGLLTEFDYENKVTRKPAKGLKVDSTKRPG
jgi:hypothetical protein